MAKKESKKWRNLVIIVVVVLIAAVLYMNYYGGPEGAVTPDYSTAELSSAWQSEGLGAEYMHSDFESLTEMPEDSLNRIKSNLQSLDASRVPAADMALASIYVDMVDIALKTKSAAASTASLKASNEDVCILLPQYQQTNAEMAEISSMIGALTLKIDSFVLQYPEKSEEAKLYGSLTEQLTLAMSVEDQAGTLALLESECA